VRADVHRNSENGALPHLDPREVLGCDAVDEAVAALVMLGFQKNASQKAVEKLLKGDPNMPVEQIVRSALKVL